jgi:hypothetical protein
VISRPIGRIFFAASVLAGALALTSPAHAQATRDDQRYIGGGAGYLHDSPDDFLVFLGGAWIPVGGPDAIVFKPLVFSPRFNYFLGLSTWQVDANMLWDIPVATDLNLRPYIGMGVGFSRTSVQGFSSNTPLLNVVTGFRYRKPDMKPQILFEMQYSSGLDYANTATVNVIVLVPFGGTR